MSSSLEMNVFSDEQTEKLIDAVKNYPAIYVKEHKHYKDCIIKENIWKEISSTLKIDIKDCKSKWKNIRDGYRKAKRKQTTGSSASKSKYNQDNLRFLEQSFLERQTITSFPETLAETANPECPDDESDENEVEEIERGKRRKTEGKRKGNKDKLLEEIKRNRTERNSILKDLLSQQRSDDDNPVVSFFTNMGRTVSEFPPELIIETKRKVFQIVNDMEMKAMQQNSAMPNQPSTSSGLGFKNWLM